MEERQVTIDGETLRLDEPYLVIATQNPVENAGTFPLPEAQLDRFMMQLSMGLPDKKEELTIIERYLGDEPLDTLTAVLSKSDIIEAQKKANLTFIHPCIREYIVDIVNATRTAPGVTLGVSPRGTLALVRCVKAYAYLSGRDYCIPDDVKAVAVPVLAHRIISDGYGMGTSENVCIVENILANLAVPTEDFHS
jgi:MoxR-like ATPase